MHSSMLQVLNTMDLIVPGGLFTVHVLGYKSKYFCYELCW